MTTQIVKLAAWVICGWMLCGGIFGDAAAQAQAPAPKPEIRGTVLEPGAARPIGEAEVMLFSAPAPGVLQSGAMFSAQNALATTKTDAMGAFRFQPAAFGSYRVQARKEGYLEGGAMLGGARSTAGVAIGPEEPSQEIRLWLSRPAEVTGRVEDEDTRKPVAGMDVFAYRVFYLREQRRRMPQGHAVTGPGGEFVIKNLPPGEIMVGLRPKPWGPQRIVKDFQPADLETVEQGYEETYWPGGADLASGYPVRLASGERRDMGPLRARRTSLYRARVSAPVPVCAEGSAVRAALADRKVGLYETVGEVPCGKDFLMQGLPPGAYDLQVEEVGKPHDSRLRGELTFQVSEKNLELTVPLGRGIDLEGRILPAEGSQAPDLTKVQVRLATTSTRARADDLRPYQPDAEGRFRLGNVQPEEKEVQVSGLPAGFYVKEVRYNGAAAARQRVALHAGALTHRVEIEVAGRPAALAGTAVKGDRPLGEALVLIVPWPVGSPSALWPVTQTNADGEGRFRFENLAPGEYRVLALDPADRARIEEPNLLARLLPSARKITLGPGAVQSERVEITELR